MHILKMLADIDALRQVVAPLCEQLVFAVTLSEEEDARLGMQLDKLLDNLTGAVGRIFLSGVGSRGCHAYPLFEILFRANDGGQQVEVATFRREERLELHFHGVA